MLTIAFWFAAVGMILATPASAEVTIDWVAVGEPGNPGDDPGSRGAVAYSYWISKFEITNAQYAEFLNAVADSDPNGLYLSGMGSLPGGITRSGSSGSYSYSTIAGRAEWPVVFVTFPNAIRFVNWLDNGQPSGAQGTGTTEDGAYTVVSSQHLIVRKTSAKRALPSRNEWYKAAYFAGGSSYHTYPYGTSTETVCSSLSTVANTANCDDAVGNPTDVGFYTLSSSPSGTMDQGGNAWEWLDEVPNNSDRLVRGGAFNTGPTRLRSGFEFTVSPEPTDPTDPDQVALFDDHGFRVVSLFDPALAMPSLTAPGAVILVATFLLSATRLLRRAS